MSHSKSENESGVAALEFALMMPILLALILGVVSVGHGLLVKYMLNNAAYEAARVCTLNQAPDLDACANAIVRKRIIKDAGGSEWCDLKVTVDPDQNIPGLTAAGPNVTAVAVNAECGYRGIIASYYLSEQGLTFVKITAKSVMPY